MPCSSNSGSGRRNWPARSRIHSMTCSTPCSEIPVSKKKVRELFAPFYKTRGPGYPGVDPKVFDLSHLSSLQAPRRCPRTQCVRLVPRQAENGGGLGQRMHALHVQQGKRFKKQSPARSRFAPRDSDRLAIVRLAFASGNPAMQEGLELSD
jgi:hypothetical protein